MNLTIGKKLTLGFLVVLLLMITLALYSLNIAQNSLLESVGGSSVFLAEQMMKTVEHSILDKIDFLELRSRGFLLREFLLKSNQEFESLDNIQDYINQRDREWISTLQDSLSAFMQELIENTLSQQLRNEYIDFWLNKYGYYVFQEAFVTNRYGANIALTARTTDYRQDDEEWWQVARAEGFYVGDISYDESSRVYGIILARRVEDEAGDFLGVIKAIMPITGLIKEAELALKRYQTTEVMLITDKGELIYDTKPFKILKDVSGKDFFKKTTRPSSFFITEEGGRRKIFSYVRSEGLAEFGVLKWVLLVSHDTAEIFSPIFILRNHIIFASFAFIVLVVLASFFISRSITRPIARLIGGTKIIGAGNLDYKLGSIATDEIGQLSLAFDKMTENLKKVTASRDELNKEIVVRRHAEEELISTYEELKKAHLQLKESEAQLIQSEKMRTLGMVTAGIAHELNNPMMGILNYVQYCIKHTPEDDRRHVILQDIEQEIGRCISIVQNLLTFSHIGKEGEKEYQKESLAAVLERILQFFSYRIDTQHVRVTKHIAEEVPRIRMKVGKIQQMFLNIITNALDALEGAEKREIHIEVSSEGEYVQAVVADTGCGIAPENVEKIFDPFFTTRPSGKGTGLGLTICQSIVEEHGGKINCESKLGEGTKFKILLLMR